MPASQTDLSVKRSHYEVARAVDPERLDEYMKSSGLNVDLSAGT
jgi:hypothetical protein